MGHALAADARWYNVSSIRNLFVWLRSVKDDADHEIFIHPLIEPHLYTLQPQVNKITKQNVYLKNASIKKW